MTKEEYQAIRQYSELNEHDRSPKEPDVLKSVNVLAELDAKAHKAKTKRERAEALYAMAATIYKQGSLLYYAPGLWRGSRAVTFDFWWNSDVNDAHEDHIRDRYLKEHEAYQHVMDLCRKVEILDVNDHVTAKAYYMDGIAAARLCNFNNTWRAKHGYQERAANSMNRLVKKFPKDRLAKSAAKYALVYASLQHPVYR